MRSHSDPKAAPESLLRLAASEHRQRKRQVRNLAILALAIAAGLGGLLYALKEVATTQKASQVAVDPSRLPPIRPGPR